MRQLYPADGVNGKGDLLANLGDGGDADGPVCGGLGLGLEDRSETDIIRPFRYRSQGLLKGVRRLANDGILSQEGARHRDGEVVLPQVDTLGLEGQGDIDLVIDDEVDAATSCHLANFFSEGVDPPARTKLVAILNQTDAACDGRLYPLNKTLWDGIAFLPRIKRGIGDEI